MKTTIVALTCITGIVASFAAGAAGGKGGTPGPGGQAIGVVRVTDLLQRLMEVRKHIEEVTADRNKARAELETLAKEVAADEAELAALKPSSLDYLKQVKALAEKKAHYNAQRDFLERQILLKQQVWTHQAYGEIVRATRDVAVERGLAAVLVKDDPNMNAVPPEAMTPNLIAMYKVLYSDGCPDITEDVQARLIAAKR
jgi:Skp family chaperone for outer membrane proteins